MSDPDTAPEQEPIPEHEPIPDADDRSRGLEPGHRFRCDGCGNVTRFDVTVTATTRRFHHFDLGGVGAVEEEEILASTLEAVVCRWCGREDGIRVEVAPATGS